MFLHSSDQKLAENTWFSHGLGWLDWAGLGWAGLGWSGQGDMYHFCKSGTCPPAQPGQGWAGLGCAVLGWAGLSWTVWGLLPSSHPPYERPQAPKVGMGTAL
jgi:hypothetical protein